MTQAVVETNLSHWPVRRGKVRDVYDLGDRLLIVATDRISAFDYILPNGIPDKGRILTQLSVFWFELLGEPHHLITADVDQMHLPGGIDRAPLRGRTILVRKTQVVPVECVVRGYLAGSGLKEYRARRTVCQIPLPEGLEESSQLPGPIFTPATKAETGHDENIAFDTMVEYVGLELSEELRRRSLEVYARGSAYARQRGIIIADTKFEWGQIDGRVILIDEALTPDSSRFWPASEYRPGHSQPSFDKQFVRDWLEQSGWDKQSPPPELPEAVTAGTRKKYVEAFERLTGRKFE
ncbi:MAG: phosphoribosylaminoimidazolesuccinocarboxamide synthase [Planctomycetes bacterium]|nr:phosphoribosylaminoimidazolesuccinocarboxamide synthase [Planctomycetota bacterium]